MHLKTRIFPTTGYARVLLFIFIRRELGGMVQDVYFSLHTVIWLVSDLGLIISLDQHCQFYVECRTIFKIPKFLLDQEAGRQGGESDFILINVLCICVFRQKYRHGAVMI